MKLVFHRDFDLELAQEDRQARRDAGACHTPEEMSEAIESARAAAFAEGRLAGHGDGLAEAAAADSARRAAALDALMPQIAALIEAADTHRAALEAQLLDFALSVCEQVFPELLRHRAHDRVLAQVRRALSVGLGSATLQVTLSPGALHLLLPDLEAAIQESGLEGRVDMRGDPDLIDGDVRVFWDSGCLEYSFTSISDRILRVLRDARSVVSTPLLEP